MNDVRNENVLGTIESAVNNEKQLILCGHIMRKIGVEKLILTRVLTETESKETSK